MPNTEDNIRRVRLLASIASAMYSNGRSLLISGLGEDLFGEEVTNVISEIDTIPADTDGFRWANASVRFIRWVVTVLQVALQEEHDGHTQDLLEAINANIQSSFEDDGSI
jgi:hypothetical protein